MTYRVLPRLVACFLLAAAVAPAPAEAFCGFYVGGADAKLFNNATQVVLMREGTRTVLSMQNNYEGPPENFALVIPVPVVLQKENVKTLDKAVFAKVDQLAAPRLVEYWEQDPCAPEINYEMAPGMAVPAPVPQSAAPTGTLGVKVEARFSVGEYEVVILSAQDSGGLEKWLALEKYKIPSGAEPLLRPYVQAGSKFFVAKVNPAKVKFEKGQAMLSPLRFHYDSETFALPVRLGLMNAKGPQDLIVHILAKGQRFEVANYPNVTIPTNLDVSERVSQDFGSFYAALFDKTVQKHPKAVVTEYSWDASTCDPCPGPTLDATDFATLGADAMPNASADAQPSWYGAYTITRLHARYTKDSLGDDLVFRSAPAIEGGREFMTRDPQAKPDAKGNLEQGSKPAQGQNQFQGRYAVRHAWTGAVACEKPHRGRWGGPPGGGEPPPRPALNLAFAANREPGQLASLVRSDTPEIDLVTGHAAGVPYGGPDPVAPPSPSEPRKAGGCAGCAVAPSSEEGFLLTALGLCALAVFRRKAR